MRKFFKPSTYIWIIVFGVVAIVYFGREILDFTTKDLVRCADQFIVRGIKYDDKISFEAREGLKKIDLKELASKNVKEKSKNELWLSYYRDCENKAIEHKASEKTVEEIVKEMSETRRLQEIEQYDREFSKGGIVDLMRPI